MNPKFYVSQRDLMVEMDGEKDTLIGASFMQNENKNKAADYLRTVADKLNEIYANDPEAAADILEEAENKIRDAQTAEKFLEEVTF